VTRSSEDIVHDLANVLTAIRGAAAAVRREIGTHDPVLPDVSRIIQATEEAVALTRELRSSLYPEGILPDLPWP
jgi:signal transduction histidine kinase